MENVIKKIVETIVAELKIELRTILSERDIEDRTKLMTLREACEYFGGVHPNTVRNWIKIGDLVSEKKGNKIFIKIKIR